MNFSLQSLFLAGGMIVAGLVMAQTPPTFPSPQTQPDSTRPTSPGTPGETPRYPGAGPDSTQEAMDPYAADKQFLKEAAESASAAVEFGKIAEEKGSSDAVKQFGKRIVADRTKEGEALKEMAAGAKVQLPSEKSRKVKKAQEKLAKLSGAEFDREYAKLMRNELKDDVKTFERESRSGKVPQFKEFATKSIPALQEHRNAAEQLAANKPKESDVSNR